ncbi:MFS transporter [Roseicella aerolata]|uniref:MFS transporter n=1 Tax=Roseicella aerolata TaxID=2883479 RepID=A0A9X1IB26_9PROT|nr:MFS transporter [Roseicella aerolata]MCB4821509.1 MFS transporter [Roseicella aerolata]
MADRRSARGLDWLNFFIADVQTGFGPFVAVYLAAQEWTEFEIGLALSVGAFTAMISQVPAGAVVDATPRKRLAALAALVSLALSALLLAAWPAPLPVLFSLVLHGFASCVLAPAVAAISLALVGRNGLGERLGRNARYRAIGNGLSAGVMGAVGAYVSGAAVFWLTAALTLPAMAALSRIRAAELAPREEAAQAAEAAGQGGFRTLLTNRGVLVFSACCALFALSNAAMLPLVGTEVTARAGSMANLVIAACIVVPQLVVAVISPWVGRLAERRGRRLVLLIGLGALPVRGLLLSQVEEPVALVLVQALDGLGAATLGVLLPLVAADLTRGTNRFNTCMGVFGLANGIGATVSTAAAGAVAAGYGVGAAFLALAGAGLLAVLLALLAMPETRPAPPAAPEPVAPIALRPERSPS